MAADTKLNGYICYDKLWQKLKERERNKSYLRAHGLNAKTMASLIRNNNVTTDTIALICEILKCQPKDIMEYKRGEKPVYVSGKKKPERKRKEYKITDLPQV